MKTKREFVTDGSQTLMLFSKCINDVFPNALILEKADGTFIWKDSYSLSPSKDKFQPKVLRKGCLVKVVNPYNEFFGKKLSVYDIDGEMITLLTHNGKMTVSALTLKVL